MDTQQTRGDPAEPNTNCNGPSTMAEKIAVIRACESMKPEDERICFDPYALHFLDPGTRQALLRNSGAFRYILAQIENQLPGISGALVARVRCFDEFVQQSTNTGYGQIIILGAGYDTRAYRMDDLKTIRVFEVDHPDTIRVKVEKIRKIFGTLPNQVTYVPADLEEDGLELKLADRGYDPTCRTLFLMEGLVMYLSPAAVDRIFSFTVKNSPKGSSVLFDYCPEDDGTGSGAGWASVRSATAFVSRQGEPLRSCVPGSIRDFLTTRGFAGIRNMTGADLRQAYFTGKNRGRTISELYSIASASVGTQTCTVGEEP
ncbi:SAM-dependent methyltransferase [Methanoregula sp.]|uniref:SAM-dependent methyltransferase n=1 Tax=Methanoregula sp. TaxID=2052170 RepID=UPI0035638984